MRRFAALLFAFLLIGCGGGGRSGGDATNGSTPVVDPASATSIGPNGATLNGNVIPNGLPSEAWFEYGTDSSLANSGSTPRQSIGSGLGVVPVSSRITGLAEGTRFYFRVRASNAKGESESSIASFTTSSSASPPAVITLAATSVGANSATLNGQATANGLPATAWFEWGTDPGLSTFTSTASQSIGSGTTSQPVDAVMTGLSPGTTYYYRVAASNSSGTTRGSIANFTPGAAPAASTLAATSVGVSTATLNGNVTPHGLATDAWFEWGTEPALVAYSTTPAQSVDSGATSQPVAAVITGLSPGTMYYYRVAAINDSGTTRGAILGFTPAAQSPTVSTSTANSAGIDNALINGSVNPNGLTTTAWFEYGTDNALASFTKTADQSVGSAVVPVPVSQAISGLAAGTTYYFRLCAENSNGTSKGVIISLTTSSLATSTIISAPIVSWKDAYGTGDTDNRIIDLGSSGAWDESGIYHPCVIEADGTVFLYYCGMDSSGTYQIGLATASASGFTGKNFDKYGSAPVLPKGSLGTWDEEGTLGPYVIYDTDDGLFKMWYRGSDFSGTQQIGYATSTDGYSWTKYDGNPILSPEAGWEGNKALSGASVLKEGSDSYEMLYAAWATGPNDNASIGLATSSDGISWTKYGGNPVLTATGSGWESLSVFSPRYFFIQDNVYHLYYSAKTADFGNEFSSIGYAYSTDLIHWIRGTNNPIMYPTRAWEQGVTPPGETENPNVLILDNVIYFYYDVFFGITPTIGGAKSSYAPF